MIKKTDDDRLYDGNNDKKHMGKIEINENKPNILIIMITKLIFMIEYVMMKKLIMIMYDNNNDKKKMTKTADNVN